MSQYINKLRTNQGDLQIDYRSLANLPTISNPNLLINSDFRNPVNQRGQTKYAPSKNILHYTIDRWGTFPSVNDGSGHSVTVNNGYITFANTNASMTAYLIQHLEFPLSGTYTLSVKVKSSTKSFSLSYRDNNTVYRVMTLNAGMNTATIKCTALNFLRFEISGVASVDLEWVKLEAGTIPTLFSPRIYAEELALCQRYYNKLQSTYPLMMTQQNVAEKYSYIPIALPVSLRDMPSIKYNNVKFLRNGVGGQWYDVETVKCVGFSKVGVTLQMDLLSATYEAGIPYFLILPNSGYIEFDAEIY
jgi:hypothetical protein